MALLPALFGPKISVSGRNGFVRRPPNAFRFSKIRAPIFDRVQV
jgi:hypothetical protein